LASLFLYGTLGPAGALGFLAVLCLVHFANRFYLERDLASRQFDSLLAGARDGVAILQDYTIVYANEAFAQLLHRSRDEIVGTEYPRYLPPHALGWTDLGALTQAGLAELEMRRPDNSLVRVEV